MKSNKTKSFQTLPSHELVKWARVSTGFDLRAACRELGKRKDVIARNFLKRTVDDEQPARRHAACYALRYATDDGEVIEKLAECATADVSAHVRNMACKSLGHHLPKYRACETLVDRLQRDYNVLVRWAAVQALNAHPETRVIEDWTRTFCTQLVDLHYPIDMQTVFHFLEVCDHPIAVTFLECFAQDERLSQDERNRATTLLESALEAAGSGSPSEDDVEAAIKELFHDLDLLDVPVSPDD